MSDKTEGPSISSTIRQWLDKSHQFIDTHPRTVKGKFIKHGREIPSRFITKGIDLQGTVKEVHAEGLIYVQHIPILKLRLPSGRVLLPKNLVFVDLTSTGSRDWLKQNLLNKHVWFQVLKVEAENDHLLQTTVYSQKVTMETTLLERVRELLPMTLAFVDLTSTGSRDWLKQNLLNKHVWFQVLTVEAQNDHLLQTAVYSQKFLLWKNCTNEKLITDGLCKVMAVPGEDLKNLTIEQSEFLNRMISLERKADKKRPRNMEGREATI